MLLHLCAGCEETRRQGWGMNEIETVAVAGRVMDMAGAPSLMQKRSKEKCYPSSPMTCWDQTLSHLHCRPFLRQVRNLASRIREASGGSRLKKLCKRG